LSYVPDSSGRHDTSHPEVVAPLDNAP